MMFTINYNYYFKFFEEFLLDADYALNAGNFQWVTGSSFLSEIPLRTLCPIKISNKWDSSGEFMRRYCPELKTMPRQYLASPWRAPMEIQRQARCIVGVDYPSPILNANTSRSENLLKIKHINGLNESKEKIITKS
jgi:cryptochrome